MPAKWKAMSRPRDEEDMGEVGHTGIATNGVYKARVE